jgi:hypothetical protein
MHDRFRKYFWDGDTNWSPTFILKRILEYASFPDLIKYPFDEVKQHLPSINLHQLRTGETRKQYLITLAPYIPNAQSWEEAIWAMLDDLYFNKHLPKK